MHRPASLVRGRKPAIALKSPIRGFERPVTLALWCSAASVETRDGRTDEGDQGAADGRVSLL